MNYNAEKSKRHYDKNKKDIAKRRILNRARNGSKIMKSTIDNKEYEWTEEELEILNNSLEKKKEVKKYDNETNISKNNNVPIFLIPEDEFNIKGQQKTIKNVKNQKISIKQAQNAFHNMIDDNILKMDKNEIQKSIGKRQYDAKIESAMNIFGSDNILDVYINPEKFYNKLLQSHLLPISSKEYLSIFVTLYKNIPKISKKNIGISLYRIQKIVEEEQINTLKECMYKIIKLSKEYELIKLETSYYYKWEDILKIYDIIKQESEDNKDSIQYMRDLVIISIYVKENVLRDNLGSIIIGNKPLKEAENEDLTIKGYNYLDLKNKILYLNDFKTSSKFKDFTLEISEDTINSIKDYLNLMKKNNNKEPKYLITKDDGSMYKNGKLTSYITDMFKRHAKVDKFSINDLRHSISTYHRDSDQRTKEELANLLQHSYLQHIRYERHSDKTYEFPIFSNNFKTKDKNLNKKVKCLMQFGEFKNTKQRGVIKENFDDKRKELYPYVIKFDNSNIQDLYTALPDINIEII